MLLPKIWYLISIQWLFLLASSSIGLIQVRSVEAVVDGPLFASSQWIVDGEGRRPSHLQTVLAEGLNMQSVERFRHNKLMVVLDNHLTVPGWCCGLNGGNGFFGDKFFDPSLRMKGLNKMALLATKFSNVIGMSFGGPKSDIELWYINMQQGAETVHAANPNVLVILSGLDYDKDLSFIHKRPVNVSFSGKGNFNDACGWISASVMDKAGFIADERRAPMFVSEFGINAQRGDVNDDRYINCFMAMAPDQDWDFAVWGLQGSYYFREGVIGMEVSLTNDGVLFHPQTGLCVLKRKEAGRALNLGPCNHAKAWTYTPQETFHLKGRNHFLHAAGAQRLVQLVKSGPLASQWNQTSNSKLHLSAVDSSCDPTSLATPQAWRPHKLGDPTSLATPQAWRLYASSRI
ncbi:hypothetical protein SAY86_001763 [Trapa natans]|uniref:Mannan endo-1,4-beta-mannosidase n=1 Tax=Trapa natans TaxID=22666 RepID=A0AAN7QYY4_TRANT|nr:hypothetical protein SAY86_001763 [Trapa natans]